MRLALGRFVSCAPASLRIIRNDSGKPILANEHSGESVHFNLSRTGGCCLIAVTRLGPIGVDVERVMAIPEIEDIVKSRFAPEEVRAIMARRGGARLRAYNCWTRNVSRRAA